MACIALWPERLSLRGSVRVESHYGPPGYGETPTQDKRLRIFVLKLPTPIDVCADTSTVAPQAMLQGVAALQLTDDVDTTALKKVMGIQVEVFGTLRHKVLGTDFTDVVIRVDSIPALTRSRRNLSASTPEKLVRRLLRYAASRPSLSPGPISLLFWCAPNFESGSPMLPHKGFAISSRS